MTKVRFCRHDDIGDVRRFIDQYWAANHILSWHDDLLDWQHKAADSYNFVIATDAVGQIAGLLGFIPTTQFDAALGDEARVLWVALWKLRDDVKEAGLGLRLLRFLTSSIPHQGIGVLGINPSHPPMYRALGFTTGTLGHFYLPRQSPGPFSIATFPNGAPATSVSSGAELTAATANDLDAVACAPGPRRHMAPAKSSHFFAQRYLAHPVYRYRVHIVTRANRPVGLLATRIADHDGASCLRLVDYWGDPEGFAGLGEAVLALIEDSGAEYADFLYAASAEPDLPLRAGFLRLEAQDEIIIPNYFEPFMSHNVPISYAYRGAVGADFVLCRADGDQDRPNRVAA